MYNKKKIYPRVTCMKSYKPSLIAFIIIAQSLLTKNKLPKDQFNFSVYIKYTIKVLNTHNLFIIPN